MVLVYFLVQNRRSRKVVRSSPHLKHRGLRKISWRKGHFSENLKEMTVCIVEEVGDFRAETRISKFK